MHASPPPPPQKKASVDSCVLIYRKQVTKAFLLVYYYKCLLTGFNVKPSRCAKWQGDKIAANLLTWVLILVASLFSL